MKTIARPRQSGKTSEILKRADNFRGYIVCANRNEAHRLFQHAKDLGLRINLPLTFHNFLTKQYSAPGVKEFHIDNADMLLQQVAQHVPISTISITTGEENETNILTEGPKDPDKPESD